MPPLLLFHLSGMPLALPVDAIAELALEPDLLSVPGAPPVLAGLANRRGAALPVVRLDRLLGLGEPRAGLFRVLVVLSRPLRWAVVAERVETVAEPTGQGRPPPDLSFNDCVAAMAGIEPHGLVPVLSPERLLRRREVMTLEAFGAQASARLEDFAFADA